MNRTLRLHSGTSVRTKMIATINTKIRTQIKTYKILKIKIEIKIFYRTVRVCSRTQSSSELNTTLYCAVKIEMISEAITE